MFVLYVVYIGVLSATFFAVQRDRAHDRAGGVLCRVANRLIAVALLLVYLVLVASGVWQGIGNWDPAVFATVLSYLLYALLALFVLFSLVNCRSVDFTQAGLFCLFFFLSLRHNRAVTDAALGTYVILTASASALLEVRGQEMAAGTTSADTRQGSGNPAIESSGPSGLWPPDRSSPAAVILGSLLLLSLAAHVSVFTYYYDFRGSGRQKGVGIGANMPTCAVDFIARHQLTGHAFVSYAFAALLIYRMSPLVKVNMDSRNDVVYGEDLYREYRTALRSPKAMRSYLARHRIDFFLLAYRDRVPAVMNVLQETGTWTPVHYDDRAFILVRRRPETEELIQREAFRVIRPPGEAPLAVDASNAAAVLEEVDRIIQNCPTTRFARAYRAQALRLLPQTEEGARPQSSDTREEP
jgi:hypothetical protein